MKVGLLLRMLALVFCMLFGIVFSTWAQAAVEEAGQCKRFVFDRLENLNQTLSVNEFRIFYAIEGSDAVVDLSDTNRNGIPDVIDDMITQLTIARVVYSDVLGLQHPLKQPRYRLASAVNVFVMKLDRVNGLASDKVVNVTMRKDIPGLGCAIRIFLNSNLQPNKKVSPAHELFHLYQYAYTMFKERWYLEGMARWIEAVFTNDATTMQNNFVNVSESQEVFQLNYEASAYWLSKARKYDRDDQLKISQDLRLRTYINGKRVIEGDRFVGKRFVKAVLESLGQLDKKIGAQKGLKRYNWPKSIQRSNEFDQSIWDTVDDLIIRKPIM